VISTTFRAEVVPETTCTHCLGTPSTSAKSFSTAAFALPRSGGALTRTLRVSPSQPAMLSREEAGTTLMGILILDPPAKSLT